MNSNVGSLDHGGIDDMDDSIGKGGQATLDHDPDRLSENENGVGGLDLDLERLTVGGEKEERGLVSTI